jgi:CheY-like chemotaxis protein
VSRSISKVLLVDDEPDIRRLGQMSLELMGRMAVVLAADGEEALALAAREKPDAILLDVMMPGMDGPHTLQRLKADPATASIPVIVLTASPSSSEVDALRALGAAGVVRKPFDPMQLAKEVQRLAGER